MLALFCRIHCRLLSNLGQRIQYVSKCLLPDLHNPFISTNKKFLLAMPKKKSTTPSEDNLLLPTPPTLLPIVDTHTHVATTFDYYRGRYKEGRYTNVFDFVTGMYEGRRVEALLDVWCEAPVQKLWKEFADAALDKSPTQKWGSIEYWFALGA